MRPSVVFKVPLIGLPAANPVNEPSGSILISIGPFRSQTRPVPRHVPVSWLAVGVVDTLAAVLDVSLAHAPSPSASAAKARTASTTDRCCLMSAPPLSSSQLHRAHPCRRHGGDPREVATSAVSGRRLSPVRCPLGYARARLGQT